MRRRRSNRGKPGKAQRQRAHALRRGMDRYGVTEEVYDGLLRRILNGRCKPVWKQSWRVSHLDVDYGGRTYRVVYDNSRKTIVTFLFPANEETKDG